MTLHAVVVRQPWASLIAHGTKTIETRGFAPKSTVRPGDRLAIVAGRAVPADGSIVGDWVSWRWGDGAKMDRRGVHEVTGRELDLPLGAVVAVVTYVEALLVVGEDGDLTECEPPCLEHRPRGAVSAGLWRWMPAWEWVDEVGYEDLTDQLPLGDFAPGRYGWMLSNPQRLTVPVPCPAVAPDGSRINMQGVFRLPAAVEAAVVAQIGGES